MENLSKKHLINNNLQKLLNMKIQNFLKRIPILFIFIITSCNLGNSQKDNLYDYLQNSELQYETEMQKEIIITALSDILNFDLSVEELKDKRYPNYTGKPNQWNLPTLINKYFVPEDENITFGKNIYKQLRKKRVYDTINEIVILLQKNNQTDEH